ncbi:MAG: hypothetical protein M3O50_07115, partial [Myxococcota bacterium]|nr:hypothetical protein [Myxococcota bacterium]
RALAPTSTRAVLRARVFGYDRVLLVLGDETIELWRSVRHVGGGYVRHASDWIAESLTGGEGSQAVGDTDAGDGPEVPILESLREVLELGPGPVPDVRGSEVPPLHAAFSLAVIVAPTWAGWQLAVRLHDATASVGPWPWRAALGLAGAVAFVGLELLLVRAYLRWLVHRFLDSVVDAIRSDPSLW